MYLIYKDFYNYVPVTVYREKDRAIEYAKTIEGGSVWDSKLETFVYDWGYIEDEQKEG